MGLDLPPGLSTFDRFVPIFENTSPGTPCAIFRAAISDFLINSSGLQAGILGAKSRFSPAVGIDYIVFVTVCQHQM